MFWKEKAMAPHSSTLAWKIPWTEEPGGLQSMGLQRVGHDWSDLAAVAVLWKKRRLCSKLPPVSSVAQSCLTLCNPTDCSTPGLPVHQLPEPTQTHVHCIGDAIQPSHPLSSSSLPAFNLAQHQGFFQWVGLYQVNKVLEFQLQHQSFQWTPRTDLL